MKNCAIPCVCVPFNHKCLVQTDRPVQLHTIDMTLQNSIMSRPHMARKLTHSVDTAGKSEGMYLVLPVIMHPTPDNKI